MPVSASRKRANLRGNKAWRARQKVKVQEYKLFLFELIDRLPDYGITMFYGLDEAGENFTFRWDQTPESDPDAYANLESWCTEKGYSFAPIMADLQRAILEQELPKLGLKLAGPGVWIPKNIPAKTAAPK